MATTSLIEFSDALAERVAAASPIVASLSVAGHAVGAGILWRADVVVGSEQMFPDADAGEVSFGADRAVKARVAGRDPGTNVIALKLEQPVSAARPAAAEPKLGALALALGRDGDATARLGIVSALGRAWHSQAGGRIDRRISIDVRLTRGEEGGPVLDAGGGLVGMSTSGPRAGASSAAGSAWRCIRWRFRRRCATRPRPRAA